MQRSPQNEGSSGDIDENKGKQDSGVRCKCPDQSSTIGEWQTAGKRQTEGKESPTPEVQRCADWDQWRESDQPENDGWVGPMAYSSRDARLPIGYRRGRVTR